MTSEQLNKQYIKTKLPNCEDEKIDIINKLMSEQYVKGLRQGKFDVQMDLYSYLEKRVVQMKTKKPKSYTNKIRKHECNYLLERIKSGQYE